MTALILVDLQNDFMPGGALPAKEGLKILPVVNHLLQQQFDLIVATQDWHPKNHESFAETHKKKSGEKILLSGLEQVLWPTHCVQDTFGAQFVSGWDTTKVTHVIHKGTEHDIDSYSAFFDNAHKKSTGLHELLQKNSIHNLVIAGVVTEYCVKYSAIDARALGYNVYVVLDGCRAVNLEIEDEARALQEMKKSGAHLISSTTDLVNTLKEING